MESRVPGLTAAANDKWLIWHACTNKINGRYGDFHKYYPDNHMLLQGSSS